MSGLKQNENKSQPLPGCSQLYRDDLVLMLSVAALPGLASASAIGCRADMCRFALGTFPNHQSDGQHRYRIDRDYQ